MTSENNEKEIQNINWAQLTNAKDELEFNLICSVLESEGIPTSRQYEGSGQFLKVFFGETRLGITVKVPEELLEKAKEILTEYNSAKIIEEPEEAIIEKEEKIDEKPPTKMGAFLGWVVIAVICVAVAYGISEGIIAIIHLFSE